MAKLLHHWVIQICPYF